MTLGTQILWLFVLALPIASIAWTVTHEEIFSEIRDYCVKQSRSARLPFARKVFLLLTCEYCFSHYVVVFFLVLTRYKLLLPDWRGYLIAGFALVAVANIYMSLFARIRIGIKSERLDVVRKEEDQKNEAPSRPPS